MQTDPVIRSCIGQMAATASNQRRVCHTISGDKSMRLTRGDKKNAPPALSKLTAE